MSRPENLSACDAAMRSFPTTSRTRSPREVADDCKPVDLPLTTLTDVSDDIDKGEETAFFEGDPIDEGAAVEFTLDDDELGLAPPAVFTNGLEERDGERFPSIQTPFKNRMMTFGTVHVKKVGLSRSETHWEPSPTFIGLPYAFARKNPKDRHYCGVMFRVSSICARELGYESWVPYIKTRGWQCKFLPDEGRYDIKFKRIEETPTNPGAQARVLMHKNFHALLVSLYARLRDPKYRNIYDDTLPLTFMKESSFIAKINYISQDLLKLYVITKRFFMPYVTRNFGDERYWTEAIAKSCHRRPVLGVFLADLVLLLCPGGNVVQDGSIQIDLMENHLDSMATEVGRRASGIRHDLQVRHFIHAQLSSRLGPASIFVSNAKRNKDAHFAICQMRILDSADVHFEKTSGLTLESPTRRRKRDDVSIGNVPRNKKKVTHGE